MLRIHQCEVGVWLNWRKTALVSTSVGLWLHKQQAENPESILSTMERGRQTKRERVEVS